jgi:iron complex transport system substrate-binding protein
MPPGAAALPRPPVPALAAERIISLAPSVTETVFALGAERALVGVSDFCDYPPAARKIDRVGSYLTPNVEAIVAKRPDVVIAVPSPGNREEVEALSSLGIRTLVVAEGPTLAHVFEAMRTIARETGREAEGAALAARLRAEIAATRARVADRPRRRALMIVGRNPLVAVGGGNLIDELLSLAGADNIAAAYGEWPRLSLEFVVRESPEVVLDGSMGGEATLDTSFYEGLGISAAKRGRVHALNLDEVLRPGPRIAAGFETLARVVHPDAFAGQPAP